MISADQSRHCSADSSVIHAADSHQWPIRFATLADLPAIVECSERAFTFLPGHAYDDGENLQMTRHLQSQILDGSIRLICDETRIIAYISFWPISDRMYIDTLAVLPAFRRQGLGRQLLTLADFEALRLDLDILTLFTKATMTGNSQFYQSCGYREIERSSYDGFCRVFYQKSSLSPPPPSAQPPEAPTPHPGVVLAEYGYKPHVGGMVTTSSNSVPTGETDQKKPEVDREETWAKASDLKLKRDRDASQAMKELQLARQETLAKAARLRSERLARAASQLPAKKPPPARKT